jgi:predicted transglutaminase-like cysteine proteinase
VPVIALMPKNTPLAIKKIIAVLLCWSYVLVVPATLEISDELLKQIHNKYGEGAQQRVIQWQKLMQTAKDFSDQEKMERVNDFFNQNVAFVDDLVHWGIDDYWATPLELLVTGAGDCEDYAIAKYFTLEELGVNEDKMRITYVKAYKLNQAHMVLTYFSTPKAVPVVLDNIISTIELATNRTDLLPVYSFNGSNLWLAKARGTGKLIGGSERLSLWTDLKQRMLNNPL